MGPDGIGRLRREWPLVLPFLVLALAVAVVPGGGLLAVELFVLWVAGFVVCRRGWGVPYGLALVVVLVLDSAPGRAAPALAAVTVATLVTAALAVLTTAPSPRLPGALLRAGVAGLVGVGMGMFLVAEPVFSWSASGVLSALTVVPSLLGSLVGGVWMTRLWVVVPRACARYRPPTAPTSAQPCPAAVCGGHSPGTAGSRSPFRFWW